MDILMIGNGFDLAHGLPTQYKDFLAWANYIRNGKKLENYNGTVDNSKITVEQKILAKKYLADNVWIEYFVEKYTTIGENWIDFESEISKIIKSLEKIRIQLVNKNVEHYKQVILDEIYLDDFFKKKFIELKYYLNGVGPALLFEKNPVPDVRNLLLKSLNDLICALEIYLKEYVYPLCQDKTLCSDIENLFVKTASNNIYVLSFNYTNILSKLYKNEKILNYDFIHGNVRENFNKNENNMVLGIDEYLTEEERSNNIDFITFQKYFQRIQKKTGCKYKKWLSSKWLSSIITSRRGHNLYIFGHSLDVTDKDIVKELLLNINIKTTIFYHNQEAYENLVINLIKIIGKDKLIECVYGNNPKIKFKKTENN